MHVRGIIILYINVDVLELEPYTCMYMYMYNIVLLVMRMHSQHKFLLPCVMDAMFKFHKYGFKTVALVCDGATSNLSMIKVLSEVEPKAYRYVESICTRIYRT